VGTQLARAAALLDEKRKIFQDYPNPSNVALLKLHRGYNKNCGCKEAKILAPIRDGMKGQDDMRWRRVIPSR
jgi:hypothetical protein